MPKIKPAPPNLRAARCCGTCRHWEWAWEGEGTCKKYPDGMNAKHSNYSADICDDFQKPKP